MRSNVRVVLPEAFDLVVGDVFQLFYRGVIEAPNPYIYSIVTVCEKGKSVPRYFEYLPDAPGRYPLTISVYDVDKTLLGQAETVLNVVKPQPPKNQVNILCLGDSLTEGCQWIGEVHRRINQTGGQPEGLGFHGVEFVGTRRKGEVGCEAYGGWKWETFTSTLEGAIWVECRHDKTIEDQHSLWTDESGNVWQIETLEQGYLKFNRYKDHTAPKPEGGYLYHKQNAKNREPIRILSVGTEISSPFLDRSTGKIDFLSYAKRNQIEKIDAVYIFLGANGLLSFDALTLSRPAYCQTLVKKGKNLVSHIREAFPDVKIRLMAPPMPSCRGGLGTNYGAQLPLSDYYDMVTYHLELNKAYQQWAQEPECRDYMEFISISAQFDAENNYPNIQKPVNSRSAKTEQLDINAVHPLPEGYMQIADAVYRNVVHTFCSGE